MNERDLLQPQTDRLHVFISSRMQELEDLRAHHDVLQIRRARLGSTQPFLKELAIEKPPDRLR